MNETIHKLETVGGHYHPQAGFTGIQGLGSLGIWKLGWPCLVGDVAMEEVQLLPEMLSQERRKSQRRWRVEPREG